MLGLLESFKKKDESDGAMAEKMDNDLKGKNGAVTC